MTRTLFDPTRHEPLTETPWDERVVHEAIVHHPLKTARTGDTVTVTRWIYDHQPAPFWRAAIGPRAAASGRHTGSGRWYSV